MGDIHKNFQPKKLVLLGEFRQRYEFTATKGQLSEHPSWTEELDASYTKKRNTRLLIFLQVGSNALWLDTQAVKNLCNGHINCLLHKLHGSVTAFLVGELFCLYFNLSIAHFI